MKRLRCKFCALLAAFLFFCAPARSYGAATVTVTVAGYAISHVLAACGILLGTGAVAVLIGTWDDADTYRVKGAARQLGSYAQKVYDGARDTASDAVEKYQQLEETLIALVTAKWGEAVSGVQLLVDDLKVYMKQLYGYGEAGQPWHVPTVPVDQVWNETSWSTRDFYNLPSSPAVLVPWVANSADHTLYLSIFVPSAYSGVMQVQNMYYDHTKDIFGVYDAASMTLTTYQRDAAQSKYALYSAVVYYAYVREDGTLRFDVQSTNYWEASSSLCVPDDAGSLPFPVFGTLADAEMYVSTGEIVNPYVSGTIPLQVDTFREDLAAADTACISDVLTFPQTEDAAAEKMAALEAAYADTAVADLEQVFADNGLAITVTDVPEETISAGDQAIVDQIGALPGQIADTINGALTIETEEAQRQLSFPQAIKEKFPFCIPFDFIYLVETLAAEKEVPRFDIPLKFDYLDFHYSEVFVVDMSVFEPVVTIFRVMLDLLFCAWLISATRHLIRG